MEILKILKDRFQDQPSSVRVPDLKKILKPAGEEPRT